MATDDDEIIVGPGTYYEAINLLGKAVYLHSSDGPGVTIINATGLDTSVVTCISGEQLDTIIEGFTVTGGNGTIFNEMRVTFFIFRPSGKDYSIFFELGRCDQNLHKYVVKVGICQGICG